MSGITHSSSDLKAAMIFVPAGDPPPTEWMAAHPDYVKIPATFVPRGAKRPRAFVPPLANSALMAGTAASVAPGMAGGAGAGPASALAETDFGEWPGSGALGGIGDVLAAAAAPLAAVGILLYASRTAFPELDERHPGRRGPDVPPPPPPLPGTTPADPETIKSGAPGFTPATPLPHAPEVVPVPAPPHMVAGDPAMPAGVISTVVQASDTGPSAGSRARSRRARKAARAVDPEVTGALAEAEWRAHHLINSAGLKLVPALVEAAVRAGWREDDKGNVAALPASPEARRKLQSANIERPVHDSGHWRWNEEAGRRLLQIQKELADQGKGQATEGYAQEARDKLEALQEELRQEMWKRERLTQNDTDGAKAAV